LCSGSNAFPVPSSTIVRNHAFKARSGARVRRRFAARRVSLRLPRGLVI
jgi:hypothetical protein